MISTGCTGALHWCTAQGPNDKLKQVLSNTQSALYLLPKSPLNAILLIWIQGILVNKCLITESCSMFVIQPLSRKKLRDTSGNCIFWGTPLKLIAIVTHWFVWMCPPANHVFTSEQLKLEQNFTWMHLMLYSCFCHMLIPPRGRKSEYRVRFSK